MSILNLVHPTTGTLPYKINNYPDGQKDIVILEQPGNIVEIYSRLNSFSDLELIICANVALKIMKVKEIHLNIPYIMGARSDRKFQDGGTRYLSKVIAPIINAQGFETVTIIDPHSDVVENVIDNIEKTDNIFLVEHALNYAFAVDAVQPVVIVSPDAGALKKIYPVMELSKLYNNLDHSFIIASKHRDVISGNITHTDVPGLHLHNENYAFMIVDDICDGGRTFIEIAKPIKAMYPNAVIYLVITHGIFSAGMEPFKPYFTKIFTTNSVTDKYSQDPLLEVTNVFL